MAWYNPVSWFKKKPPLAPQDEAVSDPIVIVTPEAFKPKTSVNEIPYFGLWVPVNLHYGFGEPVPCLDPNSFPDFKPCLYIPDVLWEDRFVFQDMRFDWHNIPRPWLADLELGMRFHKENWNSVKEFLV